MASDKPGMPSTPTSAPDSPAGTTRDAPERRAEKVEETPRREADAERGDRMPRGADEPGAGL
jgi:hypothetical protein